MSGQALASVTQPAGACRISNSRSATTSTRPGLRRVRATSSSASTGRRASPGLRSMGPLECRTLERSFSNGTRNNFPVGSPGSGSTSQTMATKVWMCFSRIATPATPFSAGPHQANSAATTACSRRRSDPFIQPVDSARRLIDAAEAGRTCPYCRFALKAGTAGAFCSACRAAHHSDCWDDNGGCAIVGCMNAPRLSDATAAPNRAGRTATARSDHAPLGGRKSTLTEEQPAPPVTTSPRRATERAALLASVLAGITLVVAVVLLATRGGTRVINRPTIVVRHAGARVPPRRSPRQPRRRRPPTRQRRRIRPARSVATWSNSARSNSCPMRARCPQRCVSAALRPS
jgi:hypothetical protein